MNKSNALIKRSIILKIMNNNSIKRINSQASTALDKRIYEIKKKVSDEEFEKINFVRHKINP